MAIENSNTTHRDVRNESGTLTVSSAEKPKVVVKIQPVVVRNTYKCPNCQVYDLKPDARNLDFECELIKNITTRTQVCSSKEERDLLWRKSPWKNETWEVLLLKVALRRLKRDTNFTFIDVGDNIGTFSLAAAASGNQVIIVEPNMENVLRLHKAISIGKLADKITILVNTVSDITYVMNEQANLTAPGSKNLKKKPGAFKTKTNLGIKLAPDFNIYDRAPPIMLNNLHHYKYMKYGMLRINMGGAEHRIISQSAWLFEKYKIVYVLMEWDQVKRHGIEPVDKADEKAFWDMMGVFVTKVFHARDAFTDATLVYEDWKTWPNDILWVMYNVEKHVLPVQLRN